MRAMKDSGVEWIGEIPEGWETRRIKHCAKVINGATPKSDNPEFWDGDIVWVTPADMKDDISLMSISTKMITIAGLNSCGTELVPEHSIVVSNRAPIGRIGYTVVPLCTNQGCKAIVTRTEINPKYLSYYLLIQTATLNMLGRGTTFLELSTFDLANFAIACPSQTEQSRIAAFLDAKCAQIDAIIEKQQQVIEMLKAYKQSVITEAVTKGLDPTVPMKDSGVEWVPQIPIRWEIGRLRYLCDRITDGSHFSPETVDSGYPYITAKNILGVGIDYESTCKISEDDYINLQNAGCRPIHGDVLMVKDGATTGRVGLMIDDEPCVVLSSVCILTPSIHTNSKFLMYLLSSEFLQEQIRLSMGGSAMPRTTLTKTMKYHAIICPLSDQIAIANYLDKRCEIIEKMINVKESVVERLTAYKKSLIYEVVTGKMEV